MSKWEEGGDKCTGLTPATTRLEPGRSDLGLVCNRAWMARSQIGHSASLKVTAAGAGGLLRYP